MSTKTLADELMAEITRVRDRITPAYVKLGPAGEPALMMMRAAMDAAIRALAEQDGVSCLRLLEVLRGFTT